MYQILWIAIAWLAGTCAILGSLMALGSLLLWLTPAQSAKSQKPREQPKAVNVLSFWQNRLKLLAFSVAIALTGISLLILVPFPQ